MALKWFVPKTYTSITEAFSAIRAELQALQPIDSLHVKWKHVNTGVQAELVNLGQSSNPALSEDSDDITTETEYSGYFKVVKASDTTVAVVDSADPTNATCGYYEHGIQRVAVSKPEAITVSATGFIYVTITYTTEYVFTFAFGTTLPASANGSIVRKIADVAFADGKITTITQAQQGILITPGVL